DAEAPPKKHQEGAQLESDESLPCGNVTRRPRPKGGSTSSVCVMD
ncbi:MAG: hypothetical protein ACI9C1_002876, partial [Candidatus Aldehydirespiratoraceae bacterium]